jgi:1-acyl-sn-glycerol-3-phosphate acyltransferase
MYRLVMLVATPIVRWWGRLTVTGLEALPTQGATVLMANHDSMWDPVVIGVAARTRQLRALAKASLWRNRPLAAVLDRMGQIPIERGRGDLAALSAAVGELERGNCIGVFPEGTVSRGEPLRALSGAGRLALAVADVQVVAARVIGSVDIVRFPRRPRLRVEFFRPADGQPRADETAVGLTKRVMAEVRDGAPYVACGRRV